MRRSCLGVLFIILFTLISSGRASARSAGLYNHLPSFFAPADTGGITLGIRQTGLQFEQGNGSVLVAELDLSRRESYRFRLILTYPAVRLEKDIIKHNFGDCLLRSEVMLLGDSLRISGFFLRGDLRIPSGSPDFLPFSRGSLDGGGGLEYRGRSRLFSYRCAATYNLVEQRVKEGDSIHRNFLLLALSLKSELGRYTSFSFSIFSVAFRGGEYSRETYLLSLTRRFSPSVSLTAGAALDAGRKEERVFNSMISVGLIYRFDSSFHKE